MSTEEGRPDPGFAVSITTGWPRHGAPEQDRRLAAALQDVYDIAVNSLDFGSGFLSTEEVHNLRILGKAIGAEPLHYGCNAWPERVVTAGTPASLKFPIGTIFPAIPCTCGAEEFWSQP